MSRSATLIGAALAFALSASAASALPVGPQRAGPAPEATPLVQLVNHDWWKFRHAKRHHFFKPHAFFHRRHKPSFSFSLSFGAPVVRHYPYYYRYYYPYQVYEPYYGSPYHYRPSYAPRYYYRW